MTEVGPADRNGLLRSRGDDRNAIASSRKRKLRHLFAVATEVQVLPASGSPSPDATTTTPVENKPLTGTGIFLNRNAAEQVYYRRPTLRSDTLKRSIIWPKPSPTSNATFATPQRDSAGLSAKDAIPSTASAVSSDLTNGENGDASLHETTSAVPPGLKGLPAATKSPKKSVSVIPLPPMPGLSRAVTPVRPPELAASGPDQGSVPVASANGLQNSDDTLAKGVDRTSVKTPILPPSRAVPAVEDDAYKSAHVTTDDGKPDSTGLEPSPMIMDAAVERSGVEEAAQSPSARGPQETSRGAELPSSPGSTTQTATTPAVHDISTDTSPDNEGPRYVEHGDGKATEDDGEGSDGEDQDARKRPDQPDVPMATSSESAEAQLLQETKDSTEKGSEAVRREASPTKATRFDTTVRDMPDVMQPSPELEQNNEVHSRTIPDSQESSLPDEMDIEDSTQPQAQGSAVERMPQLSSPKPNAPVHGKPAEIPTTTERAVTRVSTGAIRQKSVSEILGEPSRPSITVLDRPITTKGPHNQLTPVTSTPQSPTGRARSVSGRRKDKSKKQASTVVFGKQPQKGKETVTGDQRQSFLPSDDYFTPLFVQGFTQQSKWMKPIEVILTHAHKTVSTDDSFIALEDHQACRVLRRVYHLQQNDKWSLRQPKRAPEPTRPSSHWDVVMQEMKWMRTDFREERKWKMVVARNLALDCAEYVAAGPEERKLLRVNATIPPLKQTEDDGDVRMVDDQPTPDLMNSAEGESLQEEDELREPFAQTISPSAIFSMQEDDVVFSLRRSPTADQLLAELPLYGSPLKVPERDQVGHKHDPDAHWRRPALPLSKFVEGQMKITSNGPPHKRSRFDFEDSDNEDEPDQVYFGEIPQKRAKLPPIDGTVALFNPESKPIRDRLLVGHQFRPPFEHPMPPQSFYENRTASQWTQAEDDELKSLVREYSYNWTLISMMLSSKSMYSSGPERRSPWECFERWTNLDGLPTEMQKTQYFRTYFNRIEAAQRARQQQGLIAQQQQQQAAAAAAAANNGNGSGGNHPITPVRIRPSTPVRVDRRRNQKHFALIDAMRKLAKKRETAVSKQQQAASAAAARKQNETVHPTGPTKTPRDYSLMRWERDQQLAEKMAQFAQRQEASRRAAAATMLARAPVAMAATPGAAQAPPNGVPVNHAAVAAARANMPNHPVGQARPMIPVAGTANGMTAAQAQQMAGGLVPPMPMNGMPTAQLQAMQIPQQVGMGNQQQNILLQARRIAEQQRMAVGAQQAQQQQPAPPSTHQGSPPLPQAMPVQVPVPHNSPPHMRANLNGITNAAYMANAQAMMAAASFSNANGAMTSPAGAGVAGGLQRPAVVANSPRIVQNAAASQNMQNHINTLEQQIRAKNPNISQEDARNVATAQLHRMLAMQRSNMAATAMNSAAGGAGAAGSPSAAMANGMALPNTTSPHQYAALLRQQQQQQAAIMTAAAQQHHLAAAANAQLQVQQQQQQQQHGQQAQQAQMQHQRQASGSATPSTGK